MLNKKALGATAAADKLYVENVFSTYLHTGNGSSQTITNNIDLSGEGGLVWGKDRDATNGHYLTDTVRGTNSQIRTQSTAAETTATTAITAFNNNGFSVGSSAYYNQSPTTYVSWTFRKAEKFFDVVMYTGTGATQSISHNLGSTPGCIIVKATNASTNWFVWHTSLGTTGSLLLNDTGATLTNSTNQWTLPTSTTFTPSVNGNVNGNTYVAYLFAHDAGGFGDSGSDNVIKCGSFAGGDTIDLGWEPQFFIWKRTDGTSDWRMHDNMRGFPTGGTQAVLAANLSSAETTNTFFDVNPTGLKHLGSGANYIYIAIRRGPMKTPESGTEVFSPNLSASTTGNAITTGFPIDLQIDGVRPNYGLSVSNAFVDRLRGVSTNSTEVGNFLAATSTNAESSSTATFRTLGWGNTGFNQDGYLSGTGAAVYWNFRRAPGFFDVVCYTGTGSARTLSHNLTVAPELLIIKARSEVEDWSVFYNFGASSASGLALQSTAASFGVTYATNGTLNGQPTASSFFLGSNTGINKNTITYVSYMFASVAGVSKVGSYTGNGSSQTINCGFTGGARFVLLKATSTTGDWVVFDSARGIVSGNDPYLRLNSAAAEVTDKDAVDTDSTGFVVNETTGPNINTNGVTYIYLAIA